MVLLKCDPVLRQDILTDILGRNGFADVSLVAREQAFPAHRIVLGAISPTIRQILDDADYSEAREDNGMVEIHLPDFHGDQVKAFLDFVYQPNRYMNEVPAIDLISFLEIDTQGSFPVQVLGKRGRRPKGHKKDPSPHSISPRKRLRTRRVQPSYNENGDDFEEDLGDPPQSNGPPLRPNLIRDEHLDFEGVESLLSSQVKTELLTDEVDDIKMERVEDSEFWTSQEVRSLLESGSMNVWCLDSVGIENYKQQSSQFKAESAYRALFGIQESEGRILGRLLAFSDPTSEEIESQFEDSIGAMKEIAGFSNGDLLFQTVFFTRQNMSPPKSVIDLRNSLQEKMEKLPSDQIQKMMRGDHVRQTMERTSMRRSNLCNGLSINQSQALQSTTNLSHQDMSDVILLYFDSQSKQIFLKRLELSNERISESASVWIKVLFDVWCTSSHFLEKSPMLVKKFESVSEPMTIYYAGKAIMESREFKCPLCPEVFPLITQEGRNRYESHRNVHEIQNFSCQCNVLLNTTVDRTNHIKLFHSNGKYKQCSDCEFIGTNEEVTIHRNQIHQTYICDVCGHVSENVKKHNNHILKHKVFKCKECGEEFVGSSKFSHHRADVHGKEFSCEECGKIIKGRWKWLQHVKSTHGGNRFMCDICGQGFKHKLTMKRHKISVHIKNRPFVCRYGCGADYNDECNLRTHEKRRHGGIYKKGDSYKDVYKNL